MDGPIWADAHGAATHFPIALVFCSGGMDAVGFFLAARPLARDLHAVGYWTMLLGAAGSLPAVFSGLFMTKGSVWGHGALRMHHIFVWPAFGLITALATWRLMTGRRATRPALAVYLVCVSCAIGLTLGAGYWGGRLAAAPIEAQLTP